MPAKLTVARPTRKAAPEVNMDDPNAVDAMARELGVESETRIGTGEGSQVLAPEPAGEQSQVPATVPHYASPRLNTGDSGGGLEGEFEMSDVKIPQLKIVNGSGELSQKFNQGCLIFADELLWDAPNLKDPKKNPSMLFIPIKIRKQFRENLSQEENNEGLMPRIVNTRQEAEALGGSTQWIGNEKPRWSPSAACTLLIAEPEHQDREEDDRHPSFSYELDGKKWALAMYYAGGTAYNESAKAILSTAFTVLRQAGKTVLHKRVWQFSVTRKKAGNYHIWIPQMRLTKTETGADAMSFIADLVGQNQPEQAAAQAAA